MAIRATVPKMKAKPIRVSRRWCVSMSCHQTRNQGPTDAVVRLMLGTRLTRMMLPLPPLQSLLCALSVSCGHSPPESACGQDDSWRSRCVSQSISNEWARAGARQKSGKNRRACKRAQVHTSSGKRKAGHAPSAKPCPCAVQSRRAGGTMPRHES